MNNLLKGFWQGVVDELTLQSKYGSELGADTFLRWAGGICFFILGYFLVHNFDSSAVAYHQWTHATFGWAISDVPPPSKVAWHRLVGGVMCGAGVLVVTLHYIVSLYRRIKARIAASKAKESQNSPHL